MKHTGTKKHSKTINKDYAISLYNINVSMTSLGFTLSKWK